MKIGPKGFVVQRMRIARKACDGPVWETGHVLCLGGLV